MRKPAPSAPSSALGRHAHVLVEDLGVVAVPAEAVVRVLHRRDIADDVDPGGVGVHDEHRGALVAAGGGIGDRHDDQEVGDRRVGGEPLAAGDDVLVAVPDRAGLEQRRIRAGRVGLGHGERRLEIAGEQRMEIALLLLRGPREREDLGVARVRRGVAERQRGDGRAAEDLVHQAELHLAEALTPEFRVEMGGPQALGSDLVLHRRQRPHQPVEAELVDQRLQRPDPLPHEVPHPDELALEVRIGGEVPGHGACGSLPGCPNRSSPKLPTA